MTARTRLYGVSSGNGNDGVSHTYADYYVRTNDPWLLARAAAYDCYKRKAWPFLDDNLEVDGEAEYTIYVTLFEEPDFEAPTVTCPDCSGSGCDGDTTDECETCGGTGEAEDEDYETGPAAFILDVFPEKDEDWVSKRGRLVYDSLEDALSPEAIARAKGREDYTDMGHD